jgi:uncharacterized protein GlcG (DUF336 family)
MPDPARVPRVRDRSEALQQVPARQLGQGFLRKACTSALIRMRTADFVPLVKPGAALYPLLAVSGSRYSAMGGGVPLTSEGQVIAGLGVGPWKA